MSDVNYTVASSVDDAVKKLSNASDGNLLAGGMTLLPAIKLGLNDPSDLIDLSGADLNGIQVNDREVIIEAMTRHVEVATSKKIKKAIPALSQLASRIGDPQVRNRGTIGGSIANNDPAADYPAACLGLGATIATNKREIRADDFFTGLFETALDSEELITSVKFPVPERAGYEKFPNPASKYALVGVFLSKGFGGVRVAVTGASSSGVYREVNFEEALSSEFKSQALGGMSGDQTIMTSDIHALADYRAHLVGEIARRAVANCV